EPPAHRPVGGVDRDRGRQHDRRGPARDAGARRRDPRRHGRPRLLLRHRPVRDVRDPRCLRRRARGGDAGFPARHPVHRRAGADPHPGTEVTGMPTLVTDLLIGVPALLGGLCFLVAAVSMSRAGDALTRINMLSVATGLGMMLFIVSAYINDLTSGFRWFSLIMAVVAFAATVVVISVASITLARATYRSGAPLDPRTGYDDLAEAGGCDRTRPRCRRRCRSRRSRHRCAGRRPVRPGGGGPAYRLAHRRRRPALGRRARGRVAAVDRGGGPGAQQRQGPRGPVPAAVQGQRARRVPVPRPATAVGAD